MANAQGVRPAAVVMRNTVAGGHGTAPEAAERRADRPPQRTPVPTKRRRSRPTCEGCVGNKWWEYYAVRYFVGTVVGALVVAFLNSHTDSPYCGRLTAFVELGKSTFLGISLLAALGVAFCYVASSPMLTVHAGRAHLRLSALKTGGRREVGISLLLIALSILSARAFLPPIAAIAVGLILGVQIGIVFLVLRTKFGRVEEFYIQLAEARGAAKPTPEAPSRAGLEYITSYRHLREHGNPVAIVVLEGVLAHALFVLPYATWAFYLLTVWLFPATVAWVVGSALESRFVSRSLSRQ
jgi:hypothetical protein